MMMQKSTLCPIFIHYLFKPLVGINTMKIFLLVLFFSFQYSCVQVGRNICTEGSKFRIKRSIFQNLLLKNWADEKNVNLNSFSSLSFIFIMIFFFCAENFKGEEYHSSPRQEKLLYSKNI